MDVLLLPFLVLAVALKLSHEGVEGDDGAVLVGRGEGEVGAELEAAVAVVGRVGILRGVGEEEEDHHCHDHVYKYPPCHCISDSDPVSV